MSDMPRCVEERADPRLFDSMTPAEVRTYGGMPDRVPRIQEAKAICARCPVTAWCFERALRLGLVGVFAGQHLSRERMRKKGIAA